MRKSFVAMTLTLLAVASATAAPPVRQVRIRTVGATGSLPADLLAPEGKSRWHLEALPLERASIVSIFSEGDALRVEAVPDGPAGGKGTDRVYLGADRERWILPDRDPRQMKMGGTVDLELQEAVLGLADDLRIHVETVGIGWVHLPSGPREVVLERALVLRRKAGARGFVPEETIHRWVDPRAGVVGEVAGEAGPDGRTRLAADKVTVVQDVITGAADLKIYVDQEDRPAFLDILYAWDKGANTPVSSLVPDPGINNMCDLAALNSWNFSGNTSGNDTTQISTPVNASETCNSARCGYTVAGGVLGREDHIVPTDTPPLHKDNQVTQRVTSMSDVTVYLRSGAQNEGVQGAFGTGESDFCFSNFGTTTRTDVPLWKFAHNDANGFFMQAGDSWQSGVFPCEPDFFPQHCGITQPLNPNPLYAYSCTETNGQPHKGQQSVKLLKGGVVTLPSGHTLNALLTRNTADYCLNSTSTCSSFFLVSAVRTVLYYWQVPYLGSVVLLRGPQNLNFTAAEISANAETPCTNFTTLAFTDLSYGLFPPISMTVGTVDYSSVQISWNPGNDTHKITGYKVYWDTDSGSSSPYAFNSVANAGQVSFSGTSATISGLTAGTKYYFTVTSLTSYTDPSTSVTTQYESIVYPTTVSGDPSFSYPVEVTATTCGQEVAPTQMTVDKALPNVHVCWTAPPDSACAAGYDILASDTVTSDGGYTVVGQVGAVTCWDGNPNHTYILVRSRGTGGTGLWGHYGH
jgi:hypothetical protein